MDNEGQPSGLDPVDTITPWQSATIRATAKAAVATLLAMIFRLTGMVFDSDLTQFLVNSGVDLFLYGMTMWWLYKAAKGRMNATQIIEKKD